LIVSMKNFSDKNKMDEYLGSYNGKIELFNIIFDALSSGIRGDFEKTDLLILKCGDDEWTIRCYRDQYIPSLNNILKWLEKKELYEECIKVLALIEASKK